MNTHVILSTDSSLLTQATTIADRFVESWKRPGIAGIVLLGAIPRGYFDRHADIDVAIFKKRGVEIELPEKFFRIEEIEVHVWLSDYEDEVAGNWDMAKRWTYSEGRIVHDPAGRIAQLLAEKVPLRPDERRWLMMSGLTLSEWYASGLAQLWVDRGDLVSAHHMFDQALNNFFDLLFGLNDTLVPDTKWRLHCAGQLARLPADFNARLRETLFLREFSTQELARRSSVFMAMWEEMKPLVETEVGKTFEEMVQLV